MLLAVTYENGQIFQHFGRTEFFKLYEIVDGVVQNTAVVSSNGQGHGALAGVLYGLGAAALICGGIGPGAQYALQECGITVFPGAVGDADEAVQAFLQGRLVVNAGGCAGHGDGCGHHEGGCGHHEGGCGHHHC